MTGPDKPGYGRIVRRTRPVEPVRLTWSALRPSEIWRTFRAYFGLSRGAAEPIDTPERLARFLDERASFIAQTALYGYLRTRAGMRYPELFEDDPFVEAINIAKWHVWLDCLSDLATYAGGRLARQTPRATPEIARMMSDLVEGILSAVGTPAEAGGEFAGHAQRLRGRLARTDWLAVGPDEAAFTESPAGLVRWAPVMDELKELDEEIVRNSVRFRWQEVRREFGRLCNAPAVLDAASRSASR